MATTQGEGAPIKELALGMAVQIECHRISATCIVRVAKSGGGNGNKLRLVIGRTARFGIPFHTPLPKHIALTMAHAVDEAFEFLIGVHWNGARKLLVGTDFAKPMVTPIGRLGRFAQQAFQHLSLNFCRICGIARYRLQTVLEKRARQSCYTHSALFSCFKKAKITLTAGNAKAFRPFSNT